MKCPVSIGSSIELFVVKAKISRLAGTGSCVERPGED